LIVTLSILPTALFLVPDKANFVTGPHCHN
jgi:hypothetical protein